MKVHINPIPGTLENEIFITNLDADIGYYVTFDDKGSAVFNQVRRGEVRAATGIIKPAFRMDERDIRELIEAFCSLAKSRGIDPDSESKAKGKLEATEKHLEDMRSLVFIKKHINSK